MNTIENKNIVLQFPISALPPLTEEKAVQEMMAGLQKLVDIGAIRDELDDILIDYEVNLDSGYTIVHLKPESLYDGSKLNTTGTSNIYEVPSDLVSKVDLSDFDKTFSAATIQERLRLAKMNPKVRLRYTIMDYRRYYNSKKAEFKKDPEKFRKLRDMFLTDLMGLFNEILPFIEEGKQLNSLIGVSQVAPKMGQVARELSLIYRRALKSEKSAGQINKGVFQKLKKAYSEFLNQLIEVVFPESSELMGENEELPDQVTPAIAAKNPTRFSDTKTYSFTGDGRISLFN